jgi:hypothetical protein
MEIRRDVCWYLTRRVSENLPTGYMQKTQRSASGGCMQKQRQKERGGGVTARAVGSRVISRRSPSWSKVRNLDLQGYHFANRSFISFSQRWRPSLVHQTQVCTRFLPLGAARVWGTRSSLLLLQSSGHTPSSIRLSKCTTVKTIWT